MITSKENLQQNHTEKGVWEARYVRVVLEELGISTHEAYDIVSC
jgi:hypothetical protein